MQRGKERLLDEKGKQRTKNTESKTEIRNERIKMEETGMERVGWDENKKGTVGLKSGFAKTK